MYDAHIITKGIEFKQTRHNLDSKRSPFLVPDMFSKLLSGFHKKVIKKMSVDKPEIAIESEFVVQETPVITQPEVSAKTEKNFKKFPSAHALDKYPFMDKVSKVMSSARKLAISAVFKDKLQKNTVALSIEPQSIAGEQVADTSDIVVEIRNLIAKRIAIEEKINELTEVKKKISAVIDQKMAVNSITEDMISGGRIYTNVA